MIVVDSSAVIAIFRQEDDAEDYARSIAADDDPVMSAANVVETSNRAARVEKDRAGKGRTMA